jgi:hypothetical protein
MRLVVARDAASPLKIVGYRRSAGRLHSFVSISHAKGIASSLK